MSNANERPLGYAAAAPVYWEAGWRGVLPFHARSKWPPPAVKESGKTVVSYTGYNGIDPSYPDVLTWCEEFPDGNLGLRLPNNDDIAVIGIDVDDYDSKTGAATFAEAVRRWGPLPRAPRSSSRVGNRISGIRLFRVPPGTQLETVITFPELGIGDIEIIQRHHRYAICWPSIHPEGRPYWWLNDDDEQIGLPRVDELPPLLPAWVDGLKVQPRVPGEAKADVAITLTDGDPSMAVKLRLGTAISELNLPGTSRHDTTTRHVMALTRLGKSGEPGVKQALHILCNVLVALRQVDKSATPEETRREFDRMLTNDNLARELAAPGINDWVQDLVVEESAAPDQRPIESSPAPPDSDLSAVSSPDAPGLDRAANEANAPSDNEGREPDITSSMSPLERIEEGFWGSRQSLNMVWQTSMAYRTPPWSVLAICAARALAQVRPHTTLPPVIGRRGSLNWFGAIVASSAGGKTTSEEVAEHLVPGHILTCYQGTGEGILASFGQAGDPSDPDSVPEHEAVMLNVDEIDSLGAVSARTGSTMMPLLRSAFSGATLAFSYANKDKRRYVRKHTYRMTGIVGMQPKRAGWVLADADGGTPQRFMWFPATDSRISHHRPWETGPLTLPSPAEWLYPRELVIPTVAEELLVDEHVKRQRGEREALDGHALFCREKFAYALTVLDGRIEMTEEDWELSGIAAAISIYTRTLVVDELRSAARIEAIDRGEIKGIEASAADESKQLEDAERVRSALRWVLEKLTVAGEDGLSQRDLQHKCTSSNRRWLPAALQIGTSNGLIRQLDNSTIWVRI